MLGAVVATFTGLLAESRYPAFGRDVYDYRIMEGHIGVMVQVEKGLIDKAEHVLKLNGAHHLQKTEAKLPAPKHNLKRWTFVVIFIFIPTKIGLLFIYGFLSFPIPNQMVEQDSIGYVQGPRQDVPAGIVPYQGLSLIAGQPATKPLPPTDDSIQRGKVLFQINCSMCHGEDGSGNGPVGKYFSPPPADLTSEGTRSLGDNGIYKVITQGRGSMPSLAENLSLIQRWDIVNYVRSLKK
jgi:mono/diheme cytochrome c family protein